jgi:hypothetical protein
MGLDISARMFYSTHVPMGVRVSFLLVVLLVLLFSAGVLFHQYLTGALAERDERPRDARAAARPGVEPAPSYRMDSAA